MSLFDLTGQTAIITGSTKGIGRAIASRLAEHGSNVVVSSRKADMCEEVTKDINDNWAQNGARAVSIPCHIGEKEQLQQLVDKTMAEFGQIDTLVCNAAVNPFYGSIADIPDSAFDKIMESNIRSNHWLSLMVVPHMIKQKGGSIMIVSSVGGMIGSNTLGAYGISKAADVQIARNLAVEFGPQGIRANAITPGLVKTDFARALWEDPVRQERVSSKVPLRRIGEPDEIAGMAVFLASKAGAFTSGASMVIDGGSTIA